MSSGNYGNQQQQQVVEEFVEEDGQFVVTGDDGTQFYEEYVEVETADQQIATAPAPNAYYQQQDTKPRISTIPIGGHSRTPVIPSTYGARSGQFGYFPPAAPRYSSGGGGLGGVLHRPALVHQASMMRPIGPPPKMYASPSSSLLFGRREFGVDAGGVPVISSTLSLPNFLSKQPKARNRKSANKRKPCNCTKSQCLKLYCDCFANGEFCLDCNCKDCHNNLEHEAERSRAIKQSLERNPSAFKPKIGVAAKAIGKTIDMERLHQRGCHCKRSNCLKNYCECYEAKVPCTDRCKCQACKNTEHDRHHKFRDKFSTTAGGLAQLAAAAERGQRTPDSDGEEGEEGTNGGGSDICVVEGQLQHRQPNPKTQPWYYMTEDVIEATTMCLVAQAQEFEQTMTEEELERSVLKEFGRCLEQIIESAGSCAAQQQPTLSTSPMATGQ